MEKAVSGRGLGFHGTRRDIEFQALASHSSEPADSDLVIGSQFAECQLIDSWVFLMQGPEI